MGCGFQCGYRTLLSVTMNEFRSIFCYGVQQAFRGLECDAVLIHLPAIWNGFAGIQKLGSLVDGKREDLGLGVFQDLKGDSCKQFSEPEESSLVFWGNRRSNLVAVESISRLLVVVVVSCPDPPSSPPFVLQDHSGLKCTWDYIELMWATRTLYPNKSGILKHRGITGILIWNSVTAGDWFSCCA